MPSLPQPLRSGAAALLSVPACWLQRTCYRLTEPAIRLFFCPAVGFAAILGGLWGWLRPAGGPRALVRVADGR
jgi:hypothetical protein